MEPSGSVDTQQTMARQLDVSAYTVGWVCALKDEVTASRVLLDEEHKRPPKQANDGNNYIVGQMEGHNIVIAFPGAGSYGSDVISQTAAHLLRSFPNIRFGLMVGIGGAAPAPPDVIDSFNDIRLGDVVVSELKGSHGGVLQYDKGRWISDGSFEIRSHLNKPPQILLTAMKLLQSDHEIGVGQMNQYFDDISTRSIKLKKWGFQFPGRHLDQLYHTSHPHAGGANCSGCGTEKLEKRLERENDDPGVHYGLIASGNAVMKSAVYRDHLRDTWGVSCFEMEAAGLMNDFPCLTIRGISDYSDDHKNDAWQRYAAARAATYAKDLLRIIEPEEVSRAEIAAQIAENFSQVLEKVETNVTKLTEKAEDDHIGQILDWLCPLDYGAEQSDFLDKRQRGTGQWLLDSSQFQNWFHKKGQTLLCQGIPGAGKTIMAATVNDYIRNTIQDHSHSGLAFIFCNFRRQHQQKADDILSSILKQLARQDSRVIARLKQLFAQHRRLGTQPSPDDIFSALSSQHTLERVYVVIDALDEIQTPDNGRLGLISGLFKLQETIGLNLFVTSRFIPEVEKIFKEKNSDLMEIRAVDEDVQTFVRANVVQLPSFVTESEAMIDEVQGEIVRAANGMFLLARLHLNSLQDKITPKMMKRALEKLPRGSGAYEEAYKKAMMRIESQMMGFRQLGIRALSWIACAQRPLTTIELQHAIAIENGESSFDPEDLVDVVLIGSVCAGLVAIDEKSKIIRLVHYTAQEFFDKFGVNWFPQAHRDIADACATYLSYHCIESEAFDPKCHNLELYTYSAQNWGHHARFQSIDTELAFRLLDDQSKVISSARQLVLPKNCCEFHFLEGPKKISSLHLAAYFGLEEIAKAIVQKGTDITVQDDWGRSALSWAAEHGHKEVAKYLLECGLDMNSQDELRTTPLIWAIINGHSEIAKLFASENHEQGCIHSCQLELICEARRGHTESIKSILTQGVHPDVIIGEYTPLQLAARHGHHATTRVLLEHGANPDLVDLFGRSPLHNAARHDDEKLTRLLLEFKANFDLQDNTHTSALLTAAENDFTGIAEALVEVGANPNFKDVIGKFALIQAVHNNSPDTLKILLKGDPDMNLQDVNGGTALICAAVDNRSDLISLLLNKRPQLDLVDCTGSTALIWGAYHGCYKTVDMLIRSGADLNIRDAQGKTALIYAIKEDHESVALALIENGADLDIQDDDGGFALIWAIRRDLHSVLCALLRKSAALNLQDCNGGTALICALVEGHRSVAKSVRLLVACGALLDLQDNTGSTALIWAAYTGSEEAVEILLEGGANMYLQENHGEDALSYALQSNNETIVQSLLKHRSPENPQEQDCGSTTHSRSGKGKNSWFIRFRN